MNAAMGILQHFKPQKIGYRRFLYESLPVKKITNCDGEVYRATCSSGKVFHIKPTETKTRWNNWQGRSYARYVKKLKTDPDDMYEDEDVTSAGILYTMLQSDGSVVTTHPCPSLQCPAREQN